MSLDGTKQCNGSSPEDEHGYACSILGGLRFNLGFPPRALILFGQSCRGQQEYNSDGASKDRQSHFSVATSTDINLAEFCR